MPHLDPNQPKPELKPKPVALGAAAPVAGPRESVSPAARAATSSGGSLPSGKERSALFRALLVRGWEPGAAYTAVEEIRAMAGENAVAQMKAYTDTAIAGLESRISKRMDTALAEHAERMESLLRRHVERTDAALAKQAERADAALAKHVEWTESSLAKQAERTDAAIATLTSQVQELAVSVAALGGKFDSLTNQLRAIWAFLFVLLAALTGVFGILLSR